MVKTYKPCLAISFQTVDHVTSDPVSMMTSLDVWRHLMTSQLTEDKQEVLRNHAQLVCNNITLMVFAFRITTAEEYHYC